VSADRRAAEETRRFGERMRRGLVLGVVLGAVVGLIAGAIVAAVVADGRPARVAVSLVAFTLAGIALGLFWGGFSRLESPRPGTEPTEVERPIRDEPGITKDEGSPGGSRPG
jgi:hypothetical protein